MRLGGSAKGRKRAREELLRKLLQSWQKRTERAEAQRQATEEQRRAFRRRLVRPWWWTYWAACGIWWVVRHALHMLARLASEWWLVLWGDAYAYTSMQPFARARTPLALVGILWPVGVPIWQPALWIWEAVAGSVDAPAAHGDAQVEQRTCGELRTTTNLPVRAEPRLSAPMILPAKLPKGTAVLSLCTTESSVERLAAGETNHHLATAAGGGRGGVDEPGVSGGSAVTVLRAESSDVSAGRRGRLPGTWAGCYNEPSQMVHRTGNGGICRGERVDSWATRAEVEHDVAGAGSDRFR
jgi:hypothetical protein